MAKVTLNWEVLTGCPGTEVGRCFVDTDEVLDFCGQLLYSASLFPICRLYVRHLDSKRPANPGDDELWDTVESGTSWSMAILDGGGLIRDRQLASKHEVFAMLIA